MILNQPSWPRPKPEKENMSESRTAELRGIVARGYCHDKNRHKELDGDLLEAIVQELLAAQASVPDDEVLKAMQDAIDYEQREREGDEYGSHRTPEPFLRLMGVRSKLLAQCTASQKFLKLSLEMERHARGMLFETAMKSFPSAKFHEWCDLAKQIEENNGQI
jgi:hypothetical protein